MKNGDICYRYAYIWSLGWSKVINVPYRFRFDPVPGFHKRKRSYFKDWYKTPRTTNERRQWYASEGYGRLRRSAHMLPEEYDDRKRANRYFDSSWKNSKKVIKQWQKNL